MLNFSKSAFDSIRKHGEHAFPHECCGVLFGRMSGEQRIVDEVFVIENQFEEAERYHRFLITPDNYREAEKSPGQKMSTLSDFIIRIRILLLLPRNTTLTMHFLGFRMSSFQS